MSIEIGDKIASDDHCAIGILTKIGDKLMVVGDFGTVEYDEYNADWEDYYIWLSKVNKSNGKHK